MPESQVLFAGYPDAVLYDAPGTDGKKAVNHLIWGDYIGVREMTATEKQKFGAELPAGWLAVRARNNNGFIRKRDVQSNRVLEVNFVDVGQGDGCFIVTPDDKRILIDAGVSDNMYRFLRWRFNLRRPKNMTERWSPLVFDAAIITHPDADHYKGFRSLFETHDEDRRDMFFRKLYHNGIVERTGSKSLGSVSTSDALGRRYLTDVIHTMEELRRIIDDPDACGRKVYPNMLRKAVRNGFIGDALGVCCDDEFLDGYEAAQPLSIQILGPVVEPDGNGMRRLRWIENNGKTKNGHSVILKLRYKNLSLLLGGDLNIPAEDLLLEHYTRINPQNLSEQERQRLVQLARNTFQADFAKACHHGSADFTELFLQAVNSSAIVVSSGDNESFSHPRPDALGAFGKYGRGARPLIFSTELARSSMEMVRDLDKFRKEIAELEREKNATADATDRVKLETKIANKYKTLERTVVVYGMITLRSDGEKVLVAQKLEKAASKSRKWDLYRMEPDADGVLQYQSGH